MNESGGMCEVPHHAHSHSFICSFSWNVQCYFESIMDHNDVDGWMDRTTHERGAALKKMARLSFRLPARLKAKLKRLAKAENRTMSDWLCVKLRSELPTLSDAEVGAIVQHSCERSGCDND